MSSSSGFKPAPVSRREAIKRTVVFSTAFAAGEWLGRLSAAPLPAVESANRGIHLLAFGDFGTANAKQEAVARQMAAYAGKLQAPLAGVLALGDNFYQKMEMDRFDRHFEAMYPKDQLPCPFYALLGNHDYGPGYDSNQGPAKALMQLDYARDHPTSRWKMPAKWYAFELPNPQAPLVKIICLDSNLFEAALTPQEKLEQQRFVDAELAKSTEAPWVWVVAHHPLFSNGEHGDGSRLLKRFGAYVARSPVSMYLCAHDHTLQHLEVPDYKASFVVSGGGGAELHRITRSDRGYADQILGFCHLNVTHEWVDVRYIDVDGRCLHAFRRTPDGEVKVMAPQPA